MASQYFQGKFSQLVPNAAISDTTAPTFSGITSTTPNTDGSITASWSAASDATAPIEYLIYIALGSVSAASLFVSGNLVTISPALTLSKRIFTLADQTTYILNGQIYTLGVRAKDAVGNINTNTAISTATAIASGNLPTVLQTTATQLAATEVLLAADHVNFAADHATFQSDHTNFQSDHTSFLADHANFVADDAAFDSDHSAFLSDHSNFQSDHTNFGTDHTNFLGDHTNFQTDHSNLAGDHTNLAADHTNFVSDHSSFQADHTSFQGDHTNFVADHTNFVSDHSDFQGDHTDLAADIVDLDAIISALQAAVSDVTSSGGLALAIKEEPILTFEIIDEDGILI